MRPAAWLALSIAAWIAAVTLGAPGWAQDDQVPVWATQGGRVNLSPGALPEIVPPWSRAVLFRRSAASSGEAPAPLTLRPEKLPRGHSDAYLLAVLPVGAPALLPVRLLATPSARRPVATPGLPALQLRATPSVRRPVAAPGPSALQLGAPPARLLQAPFSLRRQAPLAALQLRAPASVRRVVPALPLPRMLEAPAKPAPGQIIMLADKAGATDTVYSRLYVDTDADGDLSDEQPVLDGSGPGIATAEVTVHYPKGSDARPPVQQRVFRFRLNTMAAGGAMAIVDTPVLQGWLGPREGGVTIGLADGGADAAFEASPLGSDRLWLDLNGNGVPDSTDDELPLGATLCLWGHYYTVRVPTDGRWVELKRVEPKGAAIRLRVRNGHGRRAEAQQLILTSGQPGGPLIVLGSPRSLVVLEGDQLQSVAYSLTVTPHGGHALTYTFGHALNPPGVGDGETLDLGGRVNAELDAAVSDTAQEGRTIAVSARVLTEAGSQLTGIREGETARPAGHLRIIAPGGEVVDEADVPFG